MSVRNALRILAVLAVAGSATFARAQSPAPSSPLSTPAQIDASLHKVPCDNDKRLEAVKQLFLANGATQSDLCLDEFKETTNLVVTVRGTGSGYVVVGAHYDKVAHGCGAIDNWTGIVLLAHLYGTVRQTAPSKTYLFVAFGREESGLVGSKAMVNAMSKQERKLYCAMINLDSFGLARPQVLRNVSSADLTEFVSKVAKELSVPFASASAYADADSTPFRTNGIPAVTLHALSNDWAQILHSTSDTLDRINLGSVYQSYYLALNVLARLDGCDCNQFR